MSVRKYRTTSQLEFNTAAWLDREFVNCGFYQNVPSGSVNVNGGRIDVLQRVDGRTYESFVNNWVSELDATGVNTLPTINVSGVYIDGAFHARGSSPHEPVIDFKGGRVLFKGTEVASTAVVSAEFSYKEVFVDFPGSDRVNHVFDSLRDNPDFSPHAYPSGNQRQFPLVVIDANTYFTTPGELGGGKNRNQRVTFHILSADRNEANSITDFVGERTHGKTIQGVDFNVTPQTLTAEGDRSSDYLTFTEMQASGTLAWQKIHVDDVNQREREFDFSVKRTRVDWDVQLMFLPPDGA